MMPEETSQLVSFSDVIGFIRRRIALAVLGLTLGASLGFFGSGYIPKKYKSRATLTIQSGYFHHPLVNDVVAGIQDTAEMSSQRSALLRLALDDPFLESFGPKYFQANNNDAGSAKPLDLEFVMKQIEYFPINATSFQISVITSSPTMAVAATNDVLNQFVTTLEKQRLQYLTRAQRSLVRQTEMLQHALSQESSAPFRDNLESRIDAMRSKLATLEEHLSETHPEVIAIRSQIKVLTSHGQGTPPAQRGDETSVHSVFLAPNARTTTQEIIEDLLRKIAYLTIVLNTDTEPGGGPFVDIVERPRLPIGPFSPNRAQFVMIGSVFGLVISLAVAIIGELRRAAKISPVEAEGFLDMKLLGELPPLPLLPGSTSRLMKDHPTRALFLIIAMALRSVG